MKTRLLPLVILLLLPCPLSAADLKLVYRHGEPIADREAGWKGHIDFASWIDDKHVVFASHSGKITCISVDHGKVQWSFDRVADITDWSLSRGTQRLAYLAGDRHVCVIDCTNGKKLFEADPKQLARLLRVDFVIPSRLAIAPKDGRLIVCDFSTYYGRNGYVLDSSYEKLHSTFHVDASPKELSISAKGDRIAVIAEERVLCVRDLTANRDIFFRGERVEKEPESLTGLIDAPFFSHLRDGGGDIIVYTLDNSWDTGKVFVHNFATKKVSSFDARNGHIEIDVVFPARRIVLTGTSTDLTVLDFDGKVLVHLPKVTRQRNSCVEFSPDGQRILVGSWDNTLSIFGYTE